MSFTFICIELNPLKLLISNVPTISILSPILYSSAKKPISNPIALITKFSSLKVSFKCLPSERALIESIFKFFIKNNLSHGYPSLNVKHFG